MRPAFLARMARAAALIVAAGCSSNKGKVEATTWTSTATIAIAEMLPYARWTTFYERRAISEAQRRGPQFTGE